MQSFVRRSSAFLCAGIMRTRHPATRGFRRGDIRLMHTARTDGELCRPAARIASASAGEQYIFTHKAKRARAKGCSGTRTALLPTRPPDKHIRTPRAGTPPTLLYGEHQVCIFAPVSFEKNTAARRLYNRKHPRSRSGDAAPRMARPHIGAQVTGGFALSGRAAKPRFLISPPLKNARKRG